jgi:outer membrane immunogenic protein
MKKFVLGTVALAALAVPATAADMGIRPRAVAYVPAFSWTGCHVGGVVGYEWGRDQGYTTTGGSFFFPSGGAGAPIPIVAGQQAFGAFGLDGFNGGGYAGCDYQFGSWVVGVEGDWSVVNKSGQTRFAPLGLFTTIGTFGTLGPENFWAEAQERWYATARARVGYAVDRWLFSVSGGAAWTKVDSSIFITGGTGTFNPSAATFSALDSARGRPGWTVGTAVEYAPPQLNGPFNGQWTIRAEYLYVHFKDFTTLTNPPVVITSSFIPLGYSSRLDDHIVRFGLAYKFGGFAMAAPAVYK